MALTRTASASPLPDREASRRCLVVAPSWVGDAVISQALLALLHARTPTATLDVLAPPWCAAVYERMPEVSEVIASAFRHGELRLADRRALARDLRARGYGRAYVLPNSAKSALVPLLAGIPERIGYLGEWRRWMLTDCRRLDPAATPRLVDRFALLARAPGDPATPPPPRPRLHVDPEARRAAAARLALAVDRPVAALCPGAEYGPAKRWPAPYFADLARRLEQEGLAVWLFGSANDAAVTAEIASLASGSTDLAGRTTLGEAIDLLSYARIVVTNDSGLMHVAAALDRRLVAIFGSSSADYTPPLSDRAVIARLGLPCSPCFERDCPLGHTNCLRGLSAEQVFTLARRALDGQGEDEQGS